MKKTVKILLVGLILLLVVSTNAYSVENGKMDLTAAEGVLDLIHSDTEAQRRQALRQMGGALAKLYDGWRDVLLHQLAYIEAFIDFPEEEIPRITEAFYMVDKSRSRKEHGAGLGLALAVKIAQLHHTTLSYRSQADQGTSVILV